MSEPTENILQIMPAEGWVASFEDEDSLPLVCFALVEETDGEGGVATSVRPMASMGDTIAFCDEYPNFLGVDKAEADDEWSEEVEEEAEE